MDRAVSTRAEHRGTEPRPGRAAPGSARRSCSSGALSGVTSAAIASAHLEDARDLPSVGSGCRWHSTVVGARGPAGRRRVGGRVDELDGRALEDLGERGRDAPHRPDRRAGARRSTIGSTTSRPVLPDAGPARRERGRPVGSVPSVAHDPPRSQIRRAPASSPAPRRASAPSSPVSSPVAVSASRSSPVVRTGSASSPTSSSAAYGVRAEVIAADLTDEASRVRIATQLADRGLEVDVLVNNAGFSTTGPVAEQRPRPRDRDGPHRRRGRRAPVQPLPARDGRAAAAARSSTSPRPRRSSRCPARPATRRRRRSCSRTARRSAPS